MSSVTALKVVTKWSRTAREPGQNRRDLADARRPRGLAVYRTQLDVNGSPRLGRARAPSVLSSERSVARKPHRTTDLETPHRPNLCAITGDLCGRGAGFCDNFPPHRWHCIGRARMPHLGARIGEA